MQKYLGKIVENRHVTEKVKYCKIEHVEPNELSFKAGQYITLALGQGIMRAYSISTPENETKFVETYVDITPGGPGSQFFANAKPGDDVHYMAPGGIFSFENNDRADIFISTGTGLVPFISMVTKAVNESAYPVYVIQGARTESELFLVDTLKQFAATSDKVKFDITLSREEKEGFKAGRVTAHLEEIVKNYTTNIDVYVCGGKEMINDVESQMISLGVPAPNIKYEKYY